jgi:hypothetical protein
MHGTITCQQAGIVNSLFRAKNSLFGSENPLLCGKSFSEDPGGCARVRKYKLIFQSPGTPDLLSGDHRLSDYPAVGHISVDLVGTDRVRRHSHPAIDPPLPTASPTLPALIGSRSPYRLLRFRPRGT